MDRASFAPTGGTVIAALHLPPLPGSPQSTMTMHAILQFALDNARLFAAHGVDALYLQDPGYGIGPKRTPPDIVASMAVIAHSVGEAVSIPVGLLTAGHDAEGPLAAAAAAGVDFVRLKVYVGAMVKAEGIVEGCVEEALLARRRLGIDNISILADIYDRSGVPLAPESLENAARWAAQHGAADALIITGRRFQESIELLDRVRQSKIDVPLLCGGGATAENVDQLLAHCDGVIVSGSLKAQSPNALRPWDPARIDTFMATVKDARRKMASLSSASR